MKVGILTFPNSISYGASMQMLALYTAVKKLGHDVEIINYHNSFMKNEKHIGASSHNSFFSVLKSQLRKIAHGSLYHSFSSFEQKNLSFYPKTPITDRSKLICLSSRYDAVICGSDQVWNPLITDNDLSYFLNFCSDDTKRISYAPSFGVESLNVEFGELVAQELFKFYSISVREDAGNKIVEQLTSKSADLVLDPTFLVDSSLWISSEKAHSLGRGEYILYFAVSRSDSLLKKCLKFSKENNIKMIVIGGNAVKNFRNKNPLLKYACDTGPAEWLYLIRNAKYIATNSFHGTAFSIINNKNFFVEYPSDTSSRLRQIIGDLGLDSRVVNDISDFPLEDISYDNVNEILLLKREQSLQFLRNALN